MGQAYYVNFVLIFLNLISFMFKKIQIMFIYTQFCEWLITIGNFFIVNDFEHFFS